MDTYMKRGSDTIYTVVDRLINCPKRLVGLESDAWKLTIAFRELEIQVKELKEVINKWE